MTPDEMQYDADEALEQQIPDDLAFDDYAAELDKAKAAFGDG